MNRLAPLILCLLAATCVAGCGGFAEERARLEKVERLLAEQTDKIEDIIPLVARQQAEIEAGNRAVAQAEESIAKSNEIIDQLVAELSRFVQADPSRPK